MNRWRKSTIILIGAPIILAIPLALFVGGWLVPDILGLSTQPVPKAPIAIESLLIDRADVPWLASIQDQPIPDSSGIFSDGNVETIQRTFIEPDLAGQDIARYRTVEEARARFSEGMAYGDDSLPDGLKAEMLTTSEFKVGCGFKGGEYDVCYFRGHYGSYVTELFARVNPATITYDQFRQMIYAVDRKMALVTRPKQIS